VAKLSDAFRVINALQQQGVIEQYAVGGAMAMLFWAEPVVTFDLDVFILWRATASPIITLEPLYDAVRQRGFEVAAEHILIHGTPIQFIVSPNDLGDEAIESADVRELDGVAFRVMRPEHLAALWLQAGGAKRRERVEILRQSGSLNESVLSELLHKYGVQG
jgi:hypothetical protein